MRMVLDTNVFVSALITPGGLPDQLVDHWEAGSFTLVTSSKQLDEVERVFAYEKLQRFIRPEQANRLLNSLRNLALIAENLPVLTVATDTADNVIIATAVAGGATHLVTGDKGDLLSLKQVESVLIITVREAIELLASH